MKIIKLAVISAIAVMALALILSATAMAGAAPAYQETATPTVTPIYSMINTVSIGEYGITVMLGAQCLLISLMGLAAFLWAYLQPAKPKH